MGGWVGGGRSTRGAARVPASSGAPAGRLAEHASTALPPTHPAPCSPQAESAYKCGVQVCFTAALLAVGLNKPWFYDTRLYWAECSWPCNVYITYGERFVYCLILGFYVQARPALRAARAVLPAASTAVTAGCCCGCGLGLTACRHRRRRPARLPARLHTAHLSPPLHSSPPLLPRRCR